MYQRATERMQQDIGKAPVADLGRIQALTHIGEKKSRRDPCDANLFSIHRGELYVDSLKARGLGDTELLRLLREELSVERLAEWRTALRLSQARRVLTLRELNLGQNRISIKGVWALSKALLQAGLALRKLWLEKNHLGPGAGEPVATLLEYAPEPLEELHLSHNFLNKLDVQRLLIAVARRKEYPLKGLTSRRPLWLRVEKQQDAKNWEDFGRSEGWNWTLTQTMLQEANRQLVAIRQQKGFLPKSVTEVRLICVVPWKSGGCKASHCNHAREYGPIVHLPYFWQQGEIVRPGRAPWASGRVESSPGGAHVAPAGGRVTPAGCRVVHWDASEDPTPRERSTLPGEGQGCSYDGTRMALPWSSENDPRSNAGCSQSPVEMALAAASGAAVVGAATGDGLSECAADLEELASLRQAEVVGDKGVHCKPWPDWEDVEAELVDDNCVHCESWPDWEDVEAEVLSECTSAQGPIAQEQQGLERPEVESETGCIDGETNGIEEAHHMAVVERLVAYLQKASDLVLAKRTIFHTRSGMDPRLAEVAIARFEADASHRWVCHGEAEHVSECASGRCPTDRAVGEANSIEDAHHVAVVERLVAYLQQASDLALAKRTILHARSGMDPRLAEVAIARFEADASQKQARQWQ